MKRIHAFEFGDQPWYPAVLHEALTDFIAFSWNLYPKRFMHLAEKIHKAMQVCNTTHLLDIASGAGGPTPSLLQLLQEVEPSITATLTDLYPNLVQFRRLSQQMKQVDFVESSVDATQVPSELEGFRIISNAFHHFSPPVARQVLADAVRNRQGIAVVEMLNRSALLLAGSQLTPLIVWGVTPWIKPLRLSRLLFTYLVPVVPHLIWWDGVVSCLRIYNPSELQELVADLSEEGVDPDSYDWDIGECPSHGIPGHFTYLLGTPK